MFAIEHGLLKVASGIGSEVGQWAWRADWAAPLVVSLSDFSVENIR